MLEEVEVEAARQSLPNSGAERILAYLHSLGVALGIITRNSRRSVCQALENFSQTEETLFSIIISRDDEVKVKPSPEGILLAAERFGVQPGKILVVGDYVFDMQAGNSFPTRCTSWRRM